MWYFCLCEAAGEELGLQAGTQYELFWTSLPMGFTWSLYFCQKIVSSRALQVLGPRGSVEMSDRGPAPVLVRSDGTGEAKLHYVYVDNAGVFADQPGLG